ncbi:MAG: response regulator [Eubacteriales bacterium]|nr:response regulator [Eubacteriales bacterium]
MKYTVIVAEDEELLLENVIHKIPLADEDFEVIGKAQTGVQAYELIEQQNPDVVITDIMMPMMDGIALLTKVREQFPLTKFIIMSGFSDFEYARSAIQLGVSDYLLKPLDTEELATALHRIKQEFRITQSSYEEIFQTGSGRVSPTEIARLLKDYLVKNYAENINLNLIANTLNYSPSYLTKIFCQSYDCTPNKYITNLRIMHAKQMLGHHPELSIREIGELVGYHDQGYFSRIFKKQTGHSPFDYRGGADV